MLLFDADRVVKSCRKLENKYPRGCILANFAKQYFNVEYILKNNKVRNVFYLIARKLKEPTCYATDKTQPH